MCDDSSVHDKHIKYRVARCGGKGKEKIFRGKSENLYVGKIVQFSAERSPDLDILASAIEWDKETPIVQ